MSESLGHFLATARKQRGLSQRDLATLAGIDHAHLSRIEAGEKIPSSDSLKKLCRKLGCFWPSEAVKNSLYERWRSA